MIDERLLGHFGLSPQVEPLEEPLDYAEREKGGNNPPGRSPKRTPASSSSKGKRPMSHPTGTPPEGPAKRTRASSLGTPPVSSSKPSVTPPPDLPPGRRRGLLLVLPFFFGSFFLNFLFFVQGMAACETLFSRYQGVFTAVSVDTPSKKMEEKVKRLEKENAQLREAKKEAATHRTQMEKELKRLSKESAEHEKALRRRWRRPCMTTPTRRRAKTF
ncbi:UNVERIFIED_CONTAM: hypothetical protein Slati_2194100 [Sesamum latifolium]|uniref:Uncharacterized protein n=1 Tax=Sesamum latifolium TaxID=2727402 RepID=A0AAW2WSD0_9LAMI